MNCVVFDLDGTLLDSISDICAAMNTTLGSSIPDEKCLYFVGHGLTNALRAGLEYIGREVTEEEFEQLDMDFHLEYSRFPDAHTRPYPGINSLLCKLRENGIPAGVYSNKAHAITQKLVRDLLPVYDFPFVQGWGGDYPPKPSPDAVNAFKAQTGADRVFYVGDMLTDYKTGTNAGADVAIVTWGFRTRKDLLEAGIPESVLVDTPAELEKFLGV